VFESLEHVRNYVARAVLNRAIQARQRSIRATELNEDSFPDSDTIKQFEMIERMEEQSALRSVIGNLSKQDFEIIKLRFYSGLTFIEISRMLSIPVSTLKSREDAAIRRIRERIRKKI
jgi:RNA polymerase sigma factor (sigma-70 family)